MGLAPTPDELERMRKLQSAEGQETTPKSMIEGEIPPLSPLKKSEISMLIHGLSWTHQKRILDHIEILCNNDRTWEMVRRVVMGIMTEQTTMLQQVIGQRVRELQTKAREITDENDGS